MSIKTNQNKKMTRHHSSPFPACFRPPTKETPHATPRATATTTTTTPNLTTNLYQTHLGLFSITWSHSFLARTLHLHLHPTSSSTPSTSSPSFQLTLKPFAFWSKRGSKNITCNSPEHDSSLEIQILWDFSNAKFGLGPEPESGYYIAVITLASTILLVGDLDKLYYSRVNKGKKIVRSIGHNMVVRREHVCGTRFYNTKTVIGGKSRDILIEINKTVEDDARLIIRFDNKRVIQVKHLKWKFRGSERFEIDGNQVQFCWDVCNWLFVDDISGGIDEGYALFTFRFEQRETVISNNSSLNNNERALMWSQDSCGLSYERKKMKKKLLVKTTSSSSSSLSSASSCGSSSIMEWESVEENELKAPTGFSLLVYAWKN